MTESPAFKDGDYNWKWGSAGKTAKLMAVKWCSDNGYYDTQINDKGGWSFSATCSGTVPSGWSRRFTDESAREINPSWNRTEAAKNDCQKKGYTDIDLGQYNSGGFFDYSIKCVSTPTVPPDVRWDSLVSGTDNQGNKIAFQKCNDWVNYDARSCLNSPTKPAVIKGWLPCAIGSSPGGIAPGDPALACSPISSGPTDFTCLGGQNCFAVTAFTQPPADVKWDAQVSGKDAKGSKISIQKCNNWVHNDPRSCLNSPTKPTVIKGWLPCAIGSSPGGIAPGDPALACSPISSGPTDFNCLGGQNCFAVTSIDVNWGMPVTGCDGDGRRLTIQKCNNWVNDDPKSCLNSPTSPSPVKWINCAIGSSPGGIAPGDGAMICSPLSAGPTSFPCVKGQNCFAVTSEKTDSTCPVNPLTNPLGSIWNENYKYLIMGLILLCLCVGISGFAYMSKTK